MKLWSLLFFSTLLLSSILILGGLLIIPDKTMIVEYIKPVCYGGGC